MKRHGWKIFSVVLAALLIVAFSAQAAEQVAPYRHHTGSVGKQNRVWSSGWFDNMYIFGTTEFYSKITGTPTANRTVTLPDYTGGVPLVILQSAATVTRTGTGTADVGSISIPAGWLTAGKSVKYTLGGSKSGTNAAMKVILYLSDGAVMTLTAPGNTAVDWKAEFILHELTDAANQKIVGTLLTSAAAVVVDYAAATKDVSGAVTLKAQIESQNAGDNVLCEYVFVETWVK